MVIGWLVFDCEMMINQKKYQEKIQTNATWSQQAKKMILFLTLYRIKAPPKLKILTPKFMPKLPLKSPKTEGILLTNPLSTHGVPSNSYHNQTQSV